LVGKCIERKKLVIESFKSAEDFREKMINSYNYTVNEMKDRSPERRSYLCYPLIDSNSAVKGVIFFDAVKPNVFSANEDKHENQLIRKVARKIYDIYFD
jgi:GAF domain-containing protein